MQDFTNSLSQVTSNFASLSLQLSSNGQVKHWLKVEPVVTTLALVGGLFITLSLLAFFLLQTCFSYDVRSHTLAQHLFNANLSEEAINAARVRKRNLESQETKIGWLSNLGRL